MGKKLLYLMLCVMFLSSCSLFRGESDDDQLNSYFDFRLSELASDRNAEYSSLCWYGDSIIMLPQYPSYFRNELGFDAIFSLPQEKLTTAIKRNGKRLIEPEIIELENNQLYKLIPGYEGFEGICYDGDFFYLTVEFSSKSNQAVLVKAKMSEDGKKLEILNNDHLIVDLPATVFNASYESIFVYDEHIYLIYEANGTRINRNPIAKKISTDFSSIEDVPFESIEYRITDVTSFDKTGKGWAINYFWPGDADHYLPDEDFIPNKSAVTNNPDIGIERIIPLEITDKGFEYDKSRDPIYIKKEKRDVSYNWEGLVNYHNNAFILVTDKFPNTVLRYIKK